MNWQFVLFALLLSNLFFWSHVLAHDRSISSWAWIIGSGTLIVIYLWVGILKLIDIKTAR